jgi:dihydroorotase
MRFDLLIKGGELVDPGGGRVGRFDVAVRRGRVAAVDADIGTDAAFDVLDATGLVVTPGLVDLHTHVYRGVTYWGVEADAVASRTGVTTWLDVGSAGAMNVEGLRELIVRRSQVRILALMNISYLGLTMPDFELTNLAFCDVDIFRRLTDLNRDLVIGVKVRMGASTVGSSGLEPLRRALRAGEECELPVMVHIATSPPAIDDVLDLLRPGDIVTHCFTPQTMGLVDEELRVRESALRALERGVLLDLGHGTGSFGFDVAEALLAQDVRPHTLSTDVHQMSIAGPMFDLPTTLTKFLHLGWSLPEVVEAATARPAQLMGVEREVGTLRPGAVADVALFELEHGRFPLYDVYMGAREANERLAHRLTILGGRRMEQLPQPAPAPWIGPGPLWPPTHQGRGAVGVPAV